MKILVYSNGSPSSVKALQFAARLARKLDADVAVITVRSGTHAAEPPLPDNRDIDLSDHRQLPTGVQILVHAMGVLSQEGLLEPPDSKTLHLSELPNGHLLICRSTTGRRIPLYVSFGPMIETLNHEIDRHQYDLLVIAPPRRGRMHKIVLGDTTRKLVLDLHTSVLIVRGGGVHDRFVVCVDGSAASRRQSGMLQRFLPAVEPPVEIVWVRTPDQDDAGTQIAEHYIESVRLWMAGSGKAFRTLCLEGENPAEVIVEAAGDDAVIVLGASLRHDVYRRLRGSLPMQILSRTGASVLVVKGLPEADPRFKAAIEPHE